MAIHWNKTSKYHNNKYTIDGIEFASKKESSRYTELKLLEKAGKIRNLELQKAYELIPAQYEETEDIYTKGAHKGEHKKVLQERAIVYRADFVYFDCETGQQVVEDTKGMRTKEYVIKRKLLLWRYGIKIKEI